VPQIEVTFDIDANGIVNVSAKDKGTGKEQAIRIQASGGLSEEEIEKMVKEAEQHAEEDREQRELVDAKNQAEALIHETEKNLNEHGDKIGEAEKQPITDAISDLRSAIEAEDKEAITAKTQTLQQAAAKLGEAIYQDQQQEAGAQTGGEAEAGGTQGEESASSGEDVVDADFEEVDEDKK